MLWPFNLEGRDLDISIGYAAGNVSDIIWKIRSEFKPHPTGTNFTDRNTHNESQFYLLLTEGFVRRK
jgi:hypothetical protein